MKARVALVLVAALLVSLLTACTHADIADKPIAQPDNAENDYLINVLIIRGSNEQYLEPYQHLINTIHVNANTQVATLPELLEYDLSNIDVVYPDVSLLDQRRPDLEKAVDLLEQYVSAGGNLLLEHDLYTLFPKELLGVSEFATISASNLNFHYPEVSTDLVDMQQVYREFAVNVDKYQLLDGRYLDFGVGAVVDTAQPVVVHSSGLALLVHSNYGKGTVTWANKFLPNREHFVSRLDFQPTQEGQKYFHFGYASANWLFRTKYLNTIAKRKYGFALEKVMGPYTRPGISWQNHFEVLHAFPRNDLVRFAELLKQYEQVPSFSLIRGTYDWGVWKGVVVVNENIGTSTEPQLLGESDNSFYSTGERITYQSGAYLDLGKHRGYHTLLSELNAPTRAYPQVTDLNGDGKPDLLVGTVDGKIIFFPNMAEDSSTKPVFIEEVALQPLGRDFPRFAAPAAGDLNYDGLVDLVVGGERGELYIYLNQGSKSRPQFVFAGAVEAHVGAYTAPALADWNCDGTLDLLVGTGDGASYLLPTSPADATLQFNTPHLIDRTSRKWVAPCVTDWNQDGSPDLLLGGYDGEVELYLSTPDGSLNKVGKLQGHNYNFFGSKNIHIGHNSVPVVFDWDSDGDLDLILGGLEYGPARQIDSPVLPYRNAVLENIQYCQENHLPIDVHFYAHEYKTSAEEWRELELHRQAFKNLGIQWQNIGITHHTWRANRNTLQTLLNQQDFDISYNFGFHPYGAAGQPRDGISFMPIVAPFRLTVGEKVEPFVYSTVVPNVFTFARVAESMLHFDLPITNFEHVEYRLDPGTKEYESLVRTIERLQQLHTQGCYNFMTERQQAKVLINMYYTRLNVKIHGTGFTISQDTSQVPEQAGEYTGCIGVKITPGTALANAALTSSALIQHRPNSDSLYLGVLDGAEVSWGEDKRDARITIVRSSVPVEVLEQSENKLVLKLNSTAMQQVVLESKSDLIIKGPDLNISNENNFHTVTHYGDAVTIAVHFRR